MRRLFFTFASGPPGIGLLLLRLLAGMSVLAHSIAELRAPASAALLCVAVLLGLLGILLAVGLWTPIAAALIALGAPLQCLYFSADRNYCIVIAVLATALMLIGPGRWSIDAHLFGWKRW